MCCVADTCMQRPLSLLNDNKHSETKMPRTKPGEDTLRTGSWSLLGQKITRLTALVVVFASREDLIDYCRSLILLSSMIK